MTTSKENIGPTLKRHDYILLYDGKAILCRHCGMISFNINDIKEKYCGNCHRFHKEELP